MARLPRLSIENQLHHVLQWGHNREAIYRDDADALQILDILGNAAAKYGVALHAWTLLQSHFHLLLTPQSNRSLPAMMQAFGRDYVRYFNGRHSRSGTLWAGRYRSALIEAERFLLPCMVFMDLHSVRSGLVESVQDYPWSSYRQYVGLTVARTFPRLVPHAKVWELGNTPFAREAGYRELVEAEHGTERIDRIVEAIRGGWALGSAEFVANVQQLTPRRVSKSKPGRPATMVH